ncbi:MAG: ribonuclease Z [Deltaproteobacteria bacterium]|nr:ribonuclease Z [Deltaproteobacteria bacterium]MBW1928982.1 ribonuclease Z [Deltaproteobacteria bacterium]MBW2025615.1 ribonuclease Z [Deltaproteobacteria bacterium]MBW2125968.1 ribonuclease Z [Deltaproteobacteria bacterium]RLB12663.1 MAG: ribonuclease Z [Deltaproteobacteria bacterium]
MRPSFQPRLINPPFSDPGLFIPFRFEKRALLFDLGDLHPLSPRDLLKVTHAFVTHTHMDHFIGFDTLLRHFLGRHKTLHLFGPPGFFGNVEGKLAAYTWNLVGEYENELLIHVHEVHSDKIVRKTYVCREQFKAKPVLSSTENNGIIWAEPAFTVAAALLDHRTPCLGLSLVENLYVNIIKEALQEMGLPIGPWLNRFKQAIYERKDPSSDFFVTWEEGGTIIREKRFTLGHLINKIAKISPGKKISYITDVIGTEENRQRIISFIKNSDILFIEAAFLDRDKEIARKKFHLTAKEAGQIAAEAGVQYLTLFHFSPRYAGEEELFEKEALEAYEEKRGHPPNCKSCN